MINLPQTEFREPDNPHEHDDEPLVIHARPERLATDLVLFVHGLKGHRYRYWGQIPQFIMEDIPSADVGLYYYRTAWKRIGLTRSIDLNEEARVLADALREIRRYRAIVLVAHSMGGLLAKAAIVDLLSRKQGGALRRIAGLVLLACPQLGSLRVPRLLKLFTRDGRALFPHNKTITRLDTAFSAGVSASQAADPMDRYSIPTWAIVAAEDFWVDALSAGIGVPEDQKLTVRGSHSSIIQPSHKAADSYQFLRCCMNASFGPTPSETPEEVQVLDARPEDANRIRAMALRFFGEGVTPEDVLADFAAVGNIFRVVKRITNVGEDTRERLSGYFCVIPLSAFAKGEITAGTLRGGELTVRHLPKQYEDTAALYIGAVVAKDYNSKAVVLEALRLHVWYALALGVPEVLTRPLTKDGLRIVEKHSFRPVNKSGIGELYVRLGRGQLRLFGQTGLNGSDTRLRS